MAEVGDHQHLAAGSPGRGGRDRGRDQRDPRVEGARFDLGLELEALACAQALVQPEARARAQHEAPAARLGLVPPKRRVGQCVGVVERIAHRRHQPAPVVEEPGRPAFDDPAPVRGVDRRAREHNRSAHAPTAPGYCCIFLERHDREAPAHRAAALDQREPFRFVVAHALATRAAHQRRHRARARPALRHQASQAAGAPVARDVLALGPEPHGIEPPGDPAGGIVVARARLDAVETRQLAHGLERAHPRDRGAHRLQQGVEQPISSRWRRAAALSGRLRCARTRRGCARALRARSRAPAARRTPPSAMRAAGESRAPPRAWTAHRN